MKKIIYAFAVLSITSLFTACSKDNPIVNNYAGTGKLDVEFDNSFAENDLVLNTQLNTTPSNEVLKISRIKYIISNVVLTNENGSTFTYPKTKGYFIVDEEGATVLELENIPAGNYNKIKFGLGVDQSQYDLGESNQGDFLVKAQAAGMLSDWSNGYKFLNFGGTFTAPTVTSDTNFELTVGKTAANYHYSEVTLNFPPSTPALVRASITPEVHIVVDLSKILNGMHAVKFSDNLTPDSGAIVNSGAALENVMMNIKSLFTVAHVHND